MSDFRRYMEGEYDGTFFQKSVQMGADVLRAQVIEQQVLSMQKDLLQSEKERIGKESQLDGSKLDELMEQYNVEDKFGEYLVDGAILTCNQATAEAFELPNGEKIVLEADIAEKMNNGLTKDDNKNLEADQTVLRVKENPMYVNGYRYATDKDVVVNRNIFPFRCNCNIPVNRKAEEDRINSDPECSKHGVCMHLIRLNEKWDNMPMPGKNYLKKTDVYTMIAGGAEDIIGNLSVLSEEETSGITMTSVLFCEHGGIISPVTSGQCFFGITMEQALIKMELYLAGEVGEEEIMEYILFVSQNCGLKLAQMKGGGFQETDEKAYYNDCILAWSY